MRKLAVAVAVLAAVAVALAVAVHVRFGGGARLPDRTAAPALGPDALERVADLPYPPGNIAVSASGRVLFTYHPDGHPPTSLMELRDGAPVPYAGGDASAWRTPLSVRIDGQNRLWVLDHAFYATGQPVLVAFDLATDREVHRHAFTSDVAPLLSMVNDFVVSPDGGTVYIADASPVRGRPALLVHDVAGNTTRRVLDGHPSVTTEDFRIQAPGRDMTFLFGLATLKIGVDTIALARDGGTLFYGPVTGATLWAVPTAALRDAALAPDALAARVAAHAEKPISDGASSDDQGRVYLTDPEHSAIVVVEPDGRLRTLVKDARLRWPDGLSFGPDGWLYVSCSALEDYLFLSDADRAAHAPYQIWRVRPGGSAPPGQ